MGDTLFYDFPANVLGSFFIGLLSTGANLAALYPSPCATTGISALPLAFAPRGSTLQNHGELHLGLRTGYCGSLTTFSSWLLQVVVLMVGRAMPPGKLRGTHWVQALWAIYLGMAGPLLGLVVGQHTAIAAAAAWEAAGRQRQQQPKRDGELSAQATGTATVAAGAVPASKSAAQAAGPGGKTAAEAADSDSAAEPAGQAAPACTGTCSGTGDIPSVVLEMADGDLRPVSTTASASATATAISPHVPSPPPPPLQAPPRSSSRRSIAVSVRDGELLIDLAAGCVLCTLTGVSLAYAYADRTPPHAPDRQFWWWSILLGPAGCFARWHLSRLNGLREGAWLQYGTFAANVLGCVLVFVCEALLFRLGGSLGGGSQRVALQGLMVGTAGCLTTVSTYVVEIQKLALTSPLAAYKYFLVSTVVPVSLGLLVYGIPVWLGTR
ncbi:hypothetical protein PLESTB_000227100 [Pleodorina starrii]|uniref:Fluoride ion transporter CrcB n=1 Tax=Pleodorina starrii TaxID=330485 RepID=A0A9W6BC97_9CHLO|nr:hypothetical protein PLESTB_000227100 [Pleodorina starrii]GLC70009.1 hypothetical protein PLESTF_000912400 [Pleodorina starrii]